MNHFRFLFFSAPFCRINWPNPLSGIFPLLHVLPGNRDSRDIPYLTTASLEAEFSNSCSASISSDGSGGSWSPALESPSSPPSPLQKNKRERYLQLPGLQRWNLRPLRHQHCRKTSERVIYGFLVSGIGIYLRPPTITTAEKQVRVLNAAQRPGLRHWNLRPLRHHHCRKTRESY